MNLLSPVEGEMAVRLARGAIDYMLGKKTKTSACTHSAF